MITPNSLAIIGGGITGLSAAFYAVRRKPDVHVTVYEASERLGGVLRTVQREGFLIEQSADSFLATDDMPWARKLVIDAGLESELIGTQPGARRALVLFRKRLHAVPTGFMLMAPARIAPVLWSRLLTWRGKLRLAREPLVPRREDPDREESLAEFAIRRVGREAFERLVQPLAAGIYAADPTQLSVDAALPQFVEMEREFGSLSQGLRQRNRDAEGISGARYAKFVTLRRGLSQLASTLVTHLEAAGVSVECDMMVDKIDHEPSGRWRVSAGLKSHHHDAVIITTPPATAARMLEVFDPYAAASLATIPSTSLAVVCLGYDLRQLGRWPQASGFVVPHVESTELIAASFASQKFPHRAPVDRALIRVFLGGATNPEIVNRDNDALFQIAHQALQPILCIKGSYQLATCARWIDASPQYHLGHHECVRSIEQQIARHPRLAVAGNSYHGVGLPQCVRSAREALRGLESWRAVPTTQVPGVLNKLQSGE